MDEKMTRAAIADVFEELADALKQVPMVKTGGLTILGSEHGVAGWRWSRLAPKQTWAGGCADR